MGVTSSRVCSSVSRAVPKDGKDKKRSPPRDKTYIDEEESGPQRLSQVSSVSTDSPSPSISGKQAVADDHPVVAHGEKRAAEAPSIPQSGALHPASASDIIFNTDDTDERRSIAESEEDLQRRTLVSFMVEQVEVEMASEVGKYLHVPYETTKKETSSSLWRIGLSESECVPLIDERDVVVDESLLPFHAHLLRSIAESELSETIRRSTEVASKSILVRMISIENFIHYEWNERFQALLDVPREYLTGTQWELRRECMKRLFRTFADVGLVLATVLVDELSSPDSERHIPVVEGLYGPYPDDHTYEWGNITLKFVSGPSSHHTDDADLYVAVREENSALHACSMAIHTSGHRLRTAMRMQLDVLGHRIVVCGRVAGVEMGDTIAVGSTDKGRSFECEDAEALSLLEEVGSSLYLAPHSLSYPKGEMVTSTVSQTMQCRSNGLDGRLYLSGFSHFMPIVGVQSIRGNNDQDRRGLLPHRARPELLLELCTRDAPRLYTDVLCEVSVDRNGAIREQNRIAMEAAGQALDAVISDVALSLLAIGRNDAALWKLDLSHTFHARGLRMRHLGAVLAAVRSLSSSTSSSSSSSSSSSTSPATSQPPTTGGAERDFKAVEERLLFEVAVRCIKNELRRCLRRICLIPSFERKQTDSHVASELAFRFLSLAFGTDSLTLFSSQQNSKEEGAGGGGQPASTGAAAAANTSSIPPLSSSSSSSSPPLPTSPSSPSSSTIMDQLLSAAVDGSALGSVTSSLSSPWCVSFWLDVLPRRMSSLFGYKPNNSAFSTLRDEIHLIHTCLISRFDLFLSSVGIVRGVPSGVILPLPSIPLDSYVAPNPSTVWEDAPSSPPPPSSRRTPSPQVMMASLATISHAEVLSATSASDLSLTFRWKVKHMPLQLTKDLNTLFEEQSIETERLKEEVGQDHVFVIGSRLSLLSLCRMRVEAVTSQHAVLSHNDPMYSVVMDLKDQLSILSDEVEAQLPLLLRGAGKEKEEEEEDEEEEEEEEEEAWDVARDPSVYWNLYVRALFELSLSHEQSGRLEESLSVIEDRLPHLMTRIAHNHPHTEHTEEVDEKECAHDGNENDGGGGGGGDISPHSSSSPSAHSSPAATPSSPSPRDSHIPSLVIDSNAAVEYPGSGFATARSGVSAAPSSMSCLLGEDNMIVRAMLRHSAPTALPTFTRLLCRLMFVYDKKGDAEKAFEYADQVLSRLQSEECASSREKAVSMSEVGALYRRRGLSEKALEVYSGSLSQFEVDHTGGLETGRMLHVIASLHESRGEYTMAREIYDRALSLQEDVFGSDSPYIVPLLNSTGMLYHRLHMYDEADALYSRALEIEMSYIGYLDDARVRTLKSIALLSSNVGHHQDAIEQYSVALALATESLGPAHATVGIIQDNMAQTYQALEDWPMVEKLYKRSLRIREDALGFYHLDVAASYNNLAMYYKETKQFENAEKCCTHALTIIEKNAKPDKASGLPHTSDSVHVGSSNGEMLGVTIMDNLGQLYFTQGRLEEAERVFTESLERRQDLFGAEHHSIVGTLTQLGRVYLKQERFPEAEELFQHAVSLLEAESLNEGELLSARDLSTAEHLMLLNHLGNVFYSQNRLVEAAATFQRCLTMGTNLFGPIHEEMRQLLSSLGMVHRQLQNYPTAKRFYEEALGCTIGLFGEVHIEVARAHNSLAQLYTDMRDWDAAEKQLCVSIEIQEDLLADGDRFDLASTEHMLAGVMTMSDRHGEAMKHLKRGVQVVESWDSDHLLLMALYVELAQNCERQRLYAPARDAWIRVLYFYENVLDASKQEHNIIQTLNNIGLACTYCGSYEEGELYLLRALELCGTVKIPEATKTSFNLGRLYKRSGHYEEASQFLDQALSLQLDQKGTSHMSTAKTMYELGEILLMQNEPEQAYEMLSAALPVFLDRHGPNHKYVAIVSDALAQAEVALSALTVSDHHPDHGVAVAASSVHDDAVVVVSGGEEDASEMEVVVPLHDEATTGKNNVESPIDTNSEDAVTYTTEVAASHRGRTAQLVAFPTENSVQSEVSISSDTAPSKARSATATPSVADADAENRSETPNLVSPDEE